MKNSELHVHSIYSDGDHTPSEVVRIAKEKGVKNLALTDHNSIEGVEEAIKEGKKLGVNVIPAIEIVAKEDEILGYFIDYKNKELKNNVKKLQKIHNNRMKKQIKKLNEKGIKISYRDLISKYYPNKNFIAIHLVKILMERGMGERQVLWKKYISKDSETYVPVKEISILKAIKIVKKAGGVPVLAHPWVNSDSKAILEEKTFAKLIKAGLKGIEIDNGDRDERVTLEILERIKELARKYRLVITSGSDFHGQRIINETGCHILGNNNCEDSIVEKLKKVKQS